MDLGMVGLGRMGANMTRRLLEAGHRVVAYDLDPALVTRLEEEGAEGCRVWRAWSGSSSRPGLSG